MQTAAVLPVKSFARAKQRLGAAVAGDERAELAAAMVGDVLAALGAVGALDLLVVVTAEPRAATAAHDAGAVVVHDPVEAGQSAAAVLGIEAAVTRGAERVLLVPGDCPALDADEVRTVLAAGEGGPAGAAGATVPESGRAAGEGGPAGAAGAESGAARGARSVVIVADRHGTGTNALLLTPPDAIEPAFGPGSFQRHAALAAAAGAAFHAAGAPSLHLDVDTPGDLAALRTALARRPGAAPRTRALLAELAAAA
jgi:2-phospho-L-lactate guanylyltransferase